MDIQHLRPDWIEKFPEGSSEIRLDRRSSSSFSDIFHRGKDAFAPDCAPQPDFW
jgi:hypothetical protein